jgi:aminoglycoside phosphotransferase
MQLPKTVKDNLYFLLAETSSQVGSLQVLLDSVSSTVAQRISDRHGYTYNLKMRIHDGCEATLRSGKKGEVNIYSLRAAEAIASDLEKITNLCYDCVCLMGNLAQKDVLKKQANAKLLEEINRGIDLIEEAIVEDDTRLTLKLGSIKQKLDRSHKSIFSHHLKELRENKRPEDTVTSLIIAQKIGEIGDVLLSISESIMSAKLGQPMHIDRYRTLKMALSDLGLVDAEVEPIAETKSGSGVSGVSDSNGHVGVFKDGTKAKLKEERQNVESWHEIFPGLAPQILSYKKQGKNAAMLIEHLPGQTFQQILLQGNDEMLSKTMKHLGKTIEAVWKETKHKKKSEAQHMTQLRKRLKNVMDIHPAFDNGKVKVADNKIKCINELIDDAEIIEKKFKSPFSVYIHGDFNLDNIIYDADEKKIRFIDLHRSCYQDYSQDVSVFMVSNYRLQALDKKTRKRITQVVIQFYEFSSEFAGQNKDKTFEIRLALGLARSFITSTRFILDKSLAKAMYLRGVFILESLTKLDEKSLKKYRLPIRELFA